MAASADELLKNDNFQIPLIDLQRFCQDELNTAARLFEDFPGTKFSSMVSPKIDKSIFNESAGSRRQTYTGGRVSRRRKEPIPNSHAEEDSQEISMSSLINFSSSRGKSGNDKNSSKSILELVGKFLYILNKEEKNRLNVKNSLSSHASEERDVLSVPVFKELEEDHKKEDYTASPNIQETENICEILRGDPEMEGGIVKIQNSFENAEGLEEDRGKVLVNARPDVRNARKTPQVSKEDSELDGGMGRVRLLPEGLERPHEDQNKVVVNSSTSIAESGNASAVLGQDTEGGIWGIRKLLKTSDRLLEGQHKVIVNASPRLLEANCTSEVLRGSLKIEEDIGDIKNSIENFEGFQVSGEIIEHSVYVRPEQESKVSGEENIDTLHRLQVWSQERQFYEQVQGSLKIFDRLVETSELQNRGKVYEKQSQVDTFCSELRRYNAEGAIDTDADAMNRPKKKCGRPKKKMIEWGSALSMDTKKEVRERELASDAMNHAGEHLASDSRKRVRCGSPCSASQEDAGDHFLSELRKKVRNGLSRGASKYSNEFRADAQVYHRKFSSEAATLDGKEVSSDASVAGDIIAKPIGPANDRTTNEKCKGDVTEKANAAAELKKEKLANRKNECDMLWQMSRMKKQKLLPVDDFLESWKNRLPIGWKVEVGLQRNESGKYDYYHKFISPDGVQFHELNETSKYESSVCRKENNVNGSSGTNEVELCNISPAGYRGSNQRSDILYEEDRNDELNTSSKLDSPESMSTFKKSENVDPETSARNLQRRSSKTNQTSQTNEQVPRESIDSPCTFGLSKRSMRKSSTVTSNVRGQGVDTSNVAATPGTKKSSSTLPAYGSCIGSYGTRIEYDIVTGDIRRTKSGTVFMTKLKESCRQRFRNHLHLPFSKIPLHLKKMVIQDMKSKFGEGWSVKKIKLQMSQNCKKFRGNQTKKIKKLPKNQRHKIRPMDIPVKVWKELVKTYEKLDAKRKAGEEIPQDKATKARLAKSCPTHRSGQKGIQAVVVTFEEKYGRRPSHMEKEMMQCKRWTDFVIWMETENIGVDDPIDDDPNYAITMDQI